jgi:hypothetical protein
VLSSSRRVKKGASSAVGQASAVRGLRTRGWSVWPRLARSVSREPSARTGPAATKPKATVRWSGSLRGFGPSRLLGLDLLPGIKRISSAPGTRPRARPARARNSVDRDLGRTTGTHLQQFLHPLRSPSLRSCYCSSPAPIAISAADGGPSPVGLEPAKRAYRSCAERIKLRGSSRTSGLPHRFW